MYFRLSKAGYGTVAEIKEWNAREVLQAIHYEEFQADYENTYVEMNRNP